MGERWALADAVDEDGSLKGQQIKSWRERGYAFVSGLLPEALLSELRSDAQSFYPNPEDANVADYNHFGSNGHFVFPSDYSSANNVSLHPNLLQAVADLLGVEIAELRLTQSDLWPKYGGNGLEDRSENRDQRIHCDYPNLSNVLRKTDRQPTPPRGPPRDWKGGSRPAQEPLAGVTRELPLV